MVAGRVGTRSISRSRALRRWFARRTAGSRCSPPARTALLGHVWQLEPNGHAGWSAWEELGPALPGRRLAVCLADTPVGSRPAASAPAGGRRSATRRSRTLEADVCVIGAGPAGITVSEGLVRAGANVVLAESGNWEQDPAAQELNNGLARARSSGTTGGTCATARALSAYQQSGSH